MIKVISKKSNNNEVMVTPSSSLVGNTIENVSLDIDIIAL